MREIYDPEDAALDGLRVEQRARQQTRARPIDELAQRFGHIWPSLQTGEAVLPQPAPPTRDYNPYAR